MDQSIMNIEYRPIWLDLLRSGMQPEKIRYAGADLEPIIRQFKKLTASSQSNVGPVGRFF